MAGICLHLIGPAKHAGGRPGGPHGLVRPQGAASIAARRCAAVPLAPTPARQGLECASGALRKVGRGRRLAVPAPARTGPDNHMPLAPHLMVRQLGCSWSRGK